MDLNEMRKLIDNFKNFKKLSDRDDIKNIIDEIPDSDIPMETNIIKKIGDEIIFIESWCERCFTNYDVYDREEMVDLAKKLTHKRLDIIPNLPQYSEIFKGKKLVDWEFMELPENDVNYALSIGLYK